MKRLSTMLALVALALGAMSSSASASTHLSAVYQQKVVGPYRFVFQVGPAEKMSMHRKGTTGEIMLGGKQAACTVRSSSMGGMSMGSHWCSRHFEVHAFNRKTGRVVTNAHVSITLRNIGTGKSMMVPIMSMVGATTGPSDLHYGNNVVVGAGRYMVTILINRVRTTFSFRLT